MRGTTHHHASHTHPQGCPSPHQRLRCLTVPSTHSEQILEIVVKSEVSYA